jgi:hypothetical protein
MEYTRPATWEDVKTLARHLDDAGVNYALVGGYAIAAHGFNRFTEDIDILVDPSAENSKRWILALSRLPDHAAAELTAESDVFADDKRYAVRINDEFTIDVMPSIAGISMVGAASGRDCYDRLSRPEAAPTKFFRGWKPLLHRRIFNCGWCLISHSQQLVRRLASSEPTGHTTGPYALILGR